MVNKLSAESFALSAFSYVIRSQFFDLFCKLGLSQYAKEANRRVHPSRMSRRIFPLWEICAMGNELLVHILCVACINHLDCVVLDDVSVVPLTCVRHVVARPFAEGRFAARRRALDGVDGKEGIAHVPLHVLKRVGVAVLLGHVLVERPYLGGGALGVQVLILLHRRRYP